MPAAPVGGAVATPPPAAVSSLTAHAKSVNPSMYPRGAVKLNGVGYVLAPLPHEFGLHARLLQDLALGRVVGKLVSFYVPARREPYPELTMEV